MSEIRYINRHALFVASTRAPAIAAVSKRNPDADVFAFRMVDMVRVDPNTNAPIDDEEAAQQHERVFQERLAEYIRITGSEPRDDVAELRARCAAMQSVVDAACAYADASEDAVAIRERLLTGAVGAYLEWQERSRIASTFDKSNQDYAARVDRTRELTKLGAIEVRRLLEAFRPPKFVVETRQNLAPTPPPERTWFGREHDELAASPDTWFAVLRDGRPDGSDAHIYVMARTEVGALAKLLAHILDGGGFFPMT